MFNRYKKLCELVKNLENRATQAENLINFNANLSNLYEIGTQKSINTLFNKLGALEKTLGEQNK